MNHSHVALSDESCWNENRFRSLSLITLPSVLKMQADDTLRRLAKESQISEFKWNKMEGARGRFFAQKVTEYFLPLCKREDARVDIMIWDREDSRHKIKNRDDCANLARMYFHLLRVVLRDKWDDNLRWQLIPDEHSAVNWRQSAEFAEISAGYKAIDDSLFNQSTTHRFPVRLQKRFRINDVQIGKSDQEPLLQVADFFAGIGAFSRNRYARYLEWLHSDQPSLFSETPSPKVDIPSNREIERFAVLKHFNETAKSLLLGVSLKTHSGLRTLQPKGPVNFWWYEPQHNADRAPQKPTGKDLFWE